jgi:hypothetical protein
MANISLEDFVDDIPKTAGVKPASKSSIIPQIEGVKLISLSMGKDDRGELNELLTTRESDIEPIVHVYQVYCAQSLGDDEANLVSMPMRAYDLAAPDKSRVSIDHPGILYRFN